MDELFLEWIIVVIMFILILWVGGVVIQEWIDRSKWHRDRAKGLYDKDADRRNNR